MYKKLEPTISITKLISNILICENCKISLQIIRHDNIIDVFPRVAIVIELGDMDRRLYSDELCSVRCALEWLDKTKSMLK